MGGGWVPKLAQPAREWCDTRPNQGVQVGLPKRGN